MISKTTREKYNKLQDHLQTMGSVCIGYSGGVDSTLLLSVAKEVLGPRTLAVIGKSATYPTREFEEAVELAGIIGARIRVVDTEETDDLKFRENPPDRCYFCKTELFGKLDSIAREEGIEWNGELNAVLIVKKLRSLNNRATALSRPPGPSQSTGS